MLNYGNPSKSEKPLDFQWGVEDLDVRSESSGMKHEVENVLEFFSERVFTRLTRAAFSAFQK